MVFHLLLHERKDDLGMVIGYKWHRPNCRELGNWLKNIPTQYWVTKFMIQSYLVFSNSYYKEVPTLRVHPMCAKAHECLGPTLGR